MDKRQFLKSGLMGMGCLMCLRTEQLFAANEVSSKHSREALFYEETPKGVMCLICPNECTLKRGELSDCRNRINKDGKLYTIAYGNPCAIHVDPIEKKPLYHFLPSSRSFSIATAGCNLACLNCQNWNISQSSPTETRNYDLMPEAVVDQALDNNCQTITEEGFQYPGRLLFIYDSNYTVSITVFLVDREYFINLLSCTIFHGGARMALVWII